MALSDEELKSFDAYAPAANVGLSMDQASRRDPDRYAEDLTIAEKVGVPIDTVERNRDDIQREQGLKELDLEGMRETHPRTSEFLANPENAAVASDDTFTLRNIEGVMARHKNKRGMLNNTSRGFLERVNTLTGNLIQTMGEVAEDFDEMTDRVGIPNPGIVINDDGVSWSWDVPNKNIMKVMGEQISRPGSYGYVPDFTWENLKEEPSVANLTGMIFEQGVQSLPDMLASLYTLPAYVASRTQEIAEARVENEGGGDVDTTDLAKSVFTAVAVSVMERFASKIVLGKGNVDGFKSAGKAIGGAAVVEGGTEFAQEGVEYIGETAFTGKEMTLAEGFDRSLAGLVIGAGVGGGVRGVSATYEGLTAKTRQEMEVRLESEGDQQVLDEMISYAQSSKTQQRPGDHYANFIEQLEVGEDMYVDPAALEELPSVPSFLIGRDDEIGADMSLSVKDFMTKVAPNPELLELLRPHIRMNAKTLTANELKVRETEARDMVEKAANEKAATSKVDALFSRVKDQLVASGRQSERTAKYAAAIFPAFVQSKAEVYGVGTEQILNDMVGMAGVEIIGPSTPVSSAPTVETEPRMSVEQDFTGVKLEDTVNVTGTTKTAKVTEEAQVVWDRTQKRRSVVERVAKCLGTK